MDYIIYKLDTVKVSFTVLFYINVQLKKHYPEFGDCVLLFSLICELHYFLKHTCFLLFV